MPIKYNYATAVSYDQQLSNNADTWQPINRYLVSSTESLTTV
jgi:hypothetical protein